MKRYQLEGYVGDEITAATVANMLASAGGDDIVVDLYTVGGVITEGIEVHKNRSSGRDPRTTMLLEIFNAILSDNQWCSKAFLRSVVIAAGAPHSCFESLLDLMNELAESDGGSYICLPDDTTPMIPPDEMPGWRRTDIIVTPGQRSRAERMLKHKANYKQLNLKSA